MMAAKNYKNKNSGKSEKQILEDKTQLPSVYHLVSREHTAKKSAHDEIH